MDAHDESNSIRKSTRQLIYSAIAFAFLVLVIWALQGYLVSLAVRAYRAIQAL